MIKFTYEKNCESKSPVAIVEKILSLYDAADCIYGLFRALDRPVSPFIATHNYCMRLENASEDGQMEINVSPIYHLGPEYPNEYEEKNGMELDTDAIVGLIEFTSNDLAHKTFTLGIDAGIVFKDSKIPHNKKLKLSINPLENGLFSTLSYETQITSKTFTWQDLGIDANLITQKNEYEQRQCV